ncbi:hypothetical protein BDN72DRAFT_857838 [Pluteus cervinus]|uniref:Uncharacterized protein n=1 Tax=Pluteus cervinus TaxID=181527 RepID=A0ACD3AU46_9AGAR|nr:hypothetical protein BDN72DRAFT_857838 [Pluteus cervinus]
MACYVACYDQIRILSSDMKFPVGFNCWFIALVAHWIVLMPFSLGSPNSKLCQFLERKGLLGIIRGQEVQYNDGRRNFIGGPECMQSRRIGGFQEDEETKAGPDAERVFQLLQEDAENATELNVGSPMSDRTPAHASGRHSDILDEHIPGSFDESSTYHSEVNRGFCREWKGISDFS